MLKRKRSDWFSIVATDLFCGVLAAVIILDAVSPKDVAAAHEPMLVALDFERRATLRCARDTTIFLALHINGRLVSSIDGPDPSVTETANRCVYRYLFKADPASLRLSESRVVIGQYPGIRTNVRLRSSGAGTVEFQCDGSLGKCVAT